MERPASIVKELVENSIDAGATQIDVWCEAGGRQLIRVRDNGTGIPKDELALALMPHATSKLTTIEDLFRICSLGFRGEALASIASVSEMLLTSRHETGEAAWSIQGSADSEVTPANHPIGTTLEVCDLFFNTPARRKFLKSDRTEWLKVEEVMSRLALSHPNIGFSLTHQNQKVWAVLPCPQTPQKRIGDLYGARFLDDARYVEGRTSDLTFWGWIGHPQKTRPTSDKQAFFVNGRFVRDKVLGHAVNGYYQPMVRQGTYPVYALFLTLPPEQVDVNVHPNKYELRFAEPQRIHEFIGCQLQQSPFVDRQQAPTQQKLTGESEQTAVTVAQSNSPDKHKQQNPCQQTTSSNQMHTQTHFNSPTPLVHSPVVQIEKSNIRSKVDLSEQPSWHIFAQQDPFVLGCHEGRPFAIQLRKCFSDHLKTSPNISSKLLMMPHRHTVPINWPGVDFLMQMGWELDWISEESILVRAVPVYIKSEDIKALLSTLSAAISSKRELAFWIQYYVDVIPLNRLIELFFEREAPCINQIHKNIIWLTHKVLENII
ncbi:MAG: DNA mismatch repair endonuclease MutL [Pseudomonadota bacterium]